MTVIDGQMICIRNENRLDKTNKEIKGYRQYNIQSIPKMSTFLIREYWIQLLYSFAKQLSIAGMCGCKVWVIWHDAKYTAHLGVGNPIMWVTRNQRQFSLCGIACSLIISLVPMFLPLALFVSTISLPVFLVAFSNSDVEIKTCWKWSLLPKLGVVISHEGGVRDHFCSQIVVPGTLMGRNTLIRMKF